MRKVFLFITLAFLAACEPTYKQSSFVESVKTLAQKEYGLNVEVERAGSTLGLQFSVPSLLSRISTGDEEIYRQINGLFLILVRVGLSSDISPEFVVLDIVDADNPQFRLIFTRYMEDVRKSMAEALSQTDMNSRLLEEFVIGKKRVSFDAEEMDMVRLMMMAMDAQNQPTPPGHAYSLKQIEFSDFISRVAENYTRRLLRDKKGLKDEVLLRQVTASFDAMESPKPNFRVHLDMVSQPKVLLASDYFDKEVLPLVAKKISELFKSYRYKDFSGLTVIEKNSGRMLTVPAP